MTETVLDVVYMVVLPGRDGVVYEIDTSARGVWRKIEENQTLGSISSDRATLYRLGYRARRVKIVLT